MAEGSVQLGMRPVGTASAHDRVSEEQVHDDPDVTGTNGGDPEDGSEQQSEQQSEPVIDTKELLAKVTRLEKVVDEERGNTQFYKSQLDKFTTSATNGNGANSNGANGHGTAKVSSRQPAPLPADIFTKLADPVEGATALDQWAKANGYVDRNGVEEIINGKLREVGSVSPYYSRYPELNDPSSAIYKDAERFGKEIAADPDYAQLSPMARSKMAIQLAAAQEDARRTTGKVKSDAATKAEATRIRGITAQTGPTGRGKPPDASKNGPETMTPEQKRIARSYGVSDEAYAKRANIGVTRIDRGGR